MTEETEEKQLERYSYSKISTYGGSGGCKFKFFNKYVMKNFIDSSSLATSFGSLIHELEEKIALAIQAGQIIDYTALKNHFIIGCRKIALKYPEDWIKPDKSERTYVEKMYLYLESAIYRLEKFMKENPYLEIIGIEQKFEYDYDGVHSFSGSIDRAFRNTLNGEVIIQDIKTWPVAAKETDLRAPAQFTVYSIASQHLWGVSADKIRCQYDLPLVGITQDCLADDIIVEGRPQLDKWFAGIAKKDFRPSPTPLCFWCEFCPTRHPELLETHPGAICPYFSTWQKSGDSVRDTLCKYEGLENIAIDRQLIVSQLKQSNINLKSL